MRRIVTLALALALPFTAAARTIAPLHVTSAEWPAGHPVPQSALGHDYGCSGTGVSPVLDWSKAPAGTKSFVVTLFDRYQPPQSGWWHWVLVDVPATVHHLAHGAGTPGSADFPAGARMIRPDADVPDPRYYGPCPDIGDPAHHYRITVTALDVAKIDLPDTATPADFDYVAGLHALARGSFERPLVRRK